MKSAFAFCLLACVGCFGTWPGDFTEWVIAHDSSYGESGSDTDADADADADADTDTDADADMLEMVSISAEAFTMGSPQSEIGRGLDEDQHEVTLSSGYRIGVYEITQVWFDAIMGYLPAGFTPNCDDCPVQNVVWHEAAAFANAISDTADLPHCYTCAGKGSEVTCTTIDNPYLCAGYRLPTEAEWEHAARGGRSTAFSNGGDLNKGDDTNCSGNLMLNNKALLDDIALYCGNADAPSAVGGKAETPWGLHDVHGSAWEWCNDWYQVYEGDEKDPWGSEYGSYRVARGGSWSDIPANLRSAVRIAADPAKVPNTGFRLALSGAQ